MDGVTVRADTTVDDALLHVSVIENNNTVKVTEDSNFDAADDPVLNVFEGTMSVYYRRGSGNSRRVVTASLSYEDAVNTCQTYGNSTLSPP